MWPRVCGSRLGCQNFLQNNFSSKFQGVEASIQAAKKITFERSRDPGGGGGGVSSRLFLYVTLTQNQKAD